MWYGYMMWRCVSGELDVNTPDLAIYIRLLLPKVDKRVYNLQDAAIYKLFSRLCNFTVADLEDMYSSVIFFCFQSTAHALYVMMI
jgi:hypothetical protein